MLITSQQYARGQDVFSNNAFEKNVGKEVPLNLPNGDVTKCKILAVKVSDDGTTAEFTYEIDDSLRHLFET